MTYIDQNWVNLGSKLRPMSNLGNVVKYFFPEWFLKIISVRFMDINLVKYVINGTNLVKIGTFGENCQNRVILAYFWVHNDVICQNLGKVVK